MLTPGLEISDYGIKLDFLSINLVLLLITCLFHSTPDDVQTQPPRLVVWSNLAYFFLQCTYFCEGLVLKCWWLYGCDSDDAMAHPWRILTCSWHLFLNGGGLVCRTLNCCTGAQTNLHSMHRCHWACCVHNQMNKSTAKKEAQRSL